MRNEGVNGLFSGVDGEMAEKWTAYNGTKLVLQDQDGNKKERNNGTLGWSDRQRLRRNARIARLENELTNL